MEGQVEKASERKNALSSLQREYVSERIGGFSRDLNENITRISRECFRGLVVAFDLNGKILYANDRVRFLTGIEEASPVEQVFFEYIPRQEREDVVEMFSRVYASKAMIKMPCSIPLVVGPYEVNYKNIKGELFAFSGGLLLKISDEVLVNIKEMELEKLKLLLLKHPETGLWVTDGDGVIVDVLKTNCEVNLGWRDRELVGKNISHVTAGEHDPSNDIYVVERLQKDGGHRKTEVVEGKCCLSNGQTYHVCIDTYF